MYQDNVMAPMVDWAKTRLRKLSETDKVRDESRVGSGLGKNVSNRRRHTMVYPDHVLYLATESRNKNHSAAFPVALSEWFIRLFTQPADVLHNTFLGSGTTALAAKKNGR